MEELTSEQIETLYKSGLASVLFINTDINYAAWITRTTIPIAESEWKNSIKKNVEYLEYLKSYTKLDGKTSIWTSEDFTTIDAAITTGKKLY